MDYDAITNAEYTSQMNIEATGTLNCNVMALKEAKLA